MKAMSPVRSVPSCYDAVCCVSQRSHPIGRSSSPGVEEPLADMKLCYSRLKELVPSIPQHRSVSRMEILQHVIDYICDLQLTLEGGAMALEGGAMALQRSEVTHSFSKKETPFCH